MGYWITLHLFNDHVFYNEVVPTLRGETGDLEHVYMEFMKVSTLGGIGRYTAEEAKNICNTTVTEIKKLASQFNAPFNNHNEFDINKDYEAARAYLNKRDWYYDFTRFFEYYIFLTCADFFPHLSLGKGGLYSNFKLDRKTFAYELIADFHSGTGVFCPDATGIVNWMTSEDVKLLYYDRHNLTSEYEEFLQGFLTMLEMAFNNNLGFIIGMEMIERRLSELPGYKLLPQNTWDTMDSKRLILSF
jgi:hypothetical protein